ncbi:MAG: sigma-70 family RNA polymerase sigma factor [Candidatus Melainabacteria bacterium]|nr:MAG: sigma-70 family RNA polymerase sigma factor [Candidatus Melainabacteria bacterium]
MKFFRSKRKQFEELTGQFSQDIYRLALWRLANRQDAEDVVQDTYLRAFRSFHTFQTGTNTKAWLTRICLNVINDTLKKRIRQPDTVTLESENDELESLQSQSQSLQDPAVQLASNEFDPHLLRALQKLPESLLYPLLLREIEELSYEEIAAVLSIPTGTVMSRLFRARRIVRERLTEPAQSLTKQRFADDEM